MSKQALIVVDLQNEYLPTGKLPLTGIDAALSKAARIIEHARRQGVLLLHVRHEAGTADADIFVPGSDGVKIIEAVAPAPGEAVVLKHFPNSFRDTDLLDRLKAAGIERVTVIGAMSHMCIEATARAAADFGYPVTVVHDACATRDLTFLDQTVAAAQVHTASMSALAFAYATLLSTEEYLAA